MKSLKDKWMTTFYGMDWYKINSITDLAKIQGPALIEYVIDGDPNKENLYIPGTLQKIISPSTAIDLNPDVVMVFSQIHKNEIGNQCEDLFTNVEIYFTD